MTAIATLTVNPSLDLSTAVERMIPDEKLRGERPSREPGGGGINVARAIANLGGEARAVYTRGGPAGDTLAQLLADDVAAIGVPVSDETRENVSVIETTTEQQFRLVMPGSELSDDEWRACLEVIADLDPRPEWLVASGSLAPGLADGAYAQLARACAGDGTKLVLDTSGPPLAAALDQGVFLAKPNLGELERLLDRELETDADIATAVADLVERGAAEVIVVSLGAAGAYIAGAELEGKHLRSPTVPIRSKVGAGDSMVGGIVLALARGEPLEDAVRFGVAAGAAAVMTEGSSLCRRDDTERLYRQMTAG